MGSGCMAVNCARAAAPPAHAECCAWRGPPQSSPEASLIPPLRSRVQVLDVGDAHVLLVSVPLCVGLCL